MSPAAQTLMAEAATIPPILVLELRAEARAYQWWRWQIEIDEAVDPLQQFADQAGLVETFGQDHVQEAIAAPFARLRVRAAAEEARRERVWLERRDAAECAPATGAPAPAAEPPQRQYRTPQSTIDAFFVVLHLNDPQRLAAWLADHPLDRSHLQKIWKTKCSAPHK